MMKLVPPSRISGVALAGRHSGFLVWNPEPSASELKYVGDEWALPEYSVRYHEHHDYEFHLQLSGESEWVLDGVSTVVPAKGLIAVAPRVRHLMRSKCIHSQHFIYAGIDLRAALEKIGASPSVLDGRRHFFFPDARDFIPPFTTLAQEARLERPYREQVFELTLKSFLYLFLRECEGTPRPPAYGSIIDNNTSYRVKNYLREHLSRKISVDVMARELNISRSMLFQISKRELGMTPLAYHTKLRIELAKEMLCHMPMTTIALDLGFSSSQHFSTVFRKFEGVSPSVYRGRMNIQPTR